ncbi:MAG: Gfo/Idh/MocA family oxidoreductase [Candidatus Omnitrophica bacterium]|nr:Gfo/Idh/MocA family oxidoreductase [Candidatus Omnitrophota bacterium]MCM8828776.1 Gfo/Idh/MocA family oxidoreductase [Candidatus Omnitrophota bacterium]
MKKIFYLFDRDGAHISRWAKAEVEKIFEADRRFSLESGVEPARAFSKNYDAVIIFAGSENLIQDEQKKLDAYVNSGGALVFISPCAETEIARKLTGIKTIEDTGIQQFGVFTENKSHYITQRFPAEFQLTDNLQDAKTADVETIFSTIAGKEKVPFVFTRAYGKGKICCVLAGKTRDAWTDFNFRKILIRCVAWMLGERQNEKTINCALVGYGPMFNMGKAHGNSINATAGLKTIAVCDTNPERLEAAKQELPGLSGCFTNLEEMLKMKELDLIIGIVPHNVHFEVVMKALAYGKHVVIEKPFCINVSEANQMIETAKKKNLMLSVFHNRRWDGDYVMIKKLVESGLIGDVFHIECFIGFYRHPGYWWRSYKDISGGVMHDWAAHFIDWILNLVPSKIESIYGDFQKRVWFSVTNEDHGHALIRFKNGVLADFIISSIAAINKPKWKIFGTRGAIEVNWETTDRINFVSFVSGIKQEGFVKAPQSTGWVDYYRNIADHLLMNEELLVKPEQSRRIIGVIEAAEKSSETGSLMAPFEDCE